MTSGEQTGGNDRRLPMTHVAAAEQVAALFAACNLKLPPITAAVPDPVPKIGKRCVAGTCVACPCAAGLSRGSSGSGSISSLPRPPSLLQTTNPFSHQHQLQYQAASSTASKHERQFPPRDCYGSSHTSSPPHQQADRWLYRRLRLSLHPRRQRMSVRPIERWTGQSRYPSRPVTRRTDQGLRYHRHRRTGHVYLYQQRTEGLSRPIVLPHGRRPLPATVQQSTDHRRHLGRVQRLQQRTAIQ